MGVAIADILVAGGVEVSHITTATESAIVDGDIVVLAVPYAALDGIVTKYGSQLGGRVVVDITNPLDFQTLKLVVPTDSSAAAKLSRQLPGSRVLKAFNTTFASALISKTVGPNPTTVLIAGDDADAKTALASAVIDGGIEAFDSGDLTAARELEAVGYLQLRLAMEHKISFTGGFSLTK